MVTTVPAPDDELQETGLREFRNFIYGNYHNTHFGNETESEWKKRADGHVHVMRLMLPPNHASPILDFGCGDGVLLAAAQSLGYTNLTGVDLSDALLQKAAQHTSAKLKHDDGLEFLKSQPDGAFEAVIAFDIFEHLTRPELLQVCREIARILKPGGRLIVRGPNGCSPYYGLYFWTDITHERPLTQWSLAQVLRPLGFERIQAVELPPVNARGVKSGIHVVLWHIFRAAAALRIGLETGQLRGHILTANLHLIACKGPTADA